MISTILFISSMGMATVSFAECPSRLSAEDTIECIMMEGSGDLDYGEWATEFYKETNPEKAAVIRAAYRDEIKIAEH